MPVSSSAALSNLTDPDAVVKAIEEYDNLGRNRFLDKYGFGEAREYYLLYHGKEYDSKAIVGAAHAHQHPRIGPLPRTSFSGGLTAAVRKLTELGFTVTDGTRTYGPTSAASGQRAQRYWALAVDPSRYRIEDAIRSREIDLWTSKGRPLAPGDLAIIWKTTGDGEQRGIVAFAEIWTKPRRVSNAGDPYWIGDDEPRVEDRVELRYRVPRGLPLWIDGPHHDLLKDLNVARARGGSVFNLEAEEWHSLFEAAGGELLDTNDASDELGASTSGQGYGLTKAERDAVELRAMELARDHYETDWVVEDHSKNRPYDLYCENGDEYLYVEVKGTTGELGRVILTSNEVEHARRNYPGVALFVVHGIDLERDGEQPKASGGTVSALEPFRVDNYTLRPTHYRCDLAAPSYS